LLFL
jgi:hypothetical protein